MFKVFSNKRRVNALPTLGYQFVGNESKGLNVLEVGAFVFFALVVMMIGK